MVISGGTGVSIKGSVRCWRLPQSFHSFAMTGSFFGFLMDLGVLLEIITVVSLPLNDRVLFRFF